jgi:hypothetical protein
LAHAKNRLQATRAVFNCRLIAGGHQAAVKRWKRFCKKRVKKNEKLVFGKIAKRYECIQGPMILKTFTPKNLPKKNWRFLLKTKQNYAKIGS